MNASPLPKCYCLYKPYVYMEEEEKLRSQVEAGVSKMYVRRTS